MTNPVRTERQLPEPPRPATGLGTAGRLLYEATRDGIRSTAAQLRRNGGLPPFGSVREKERDLDRVAISASYWFLQDTGISAVDFGLGEGEQEQLLRAGEDAAGAFLADWDFPAWLAACR